MILSMSVEQALLLRQAVRLARSQAEQPSRREFRAVEIMLDAEIDSRDSSAFDSAVSKTETARISEPA